MLNGITFDAQNVQSADDAKLFYRLLGKQNGVVTGCAVTASGGNLTVAAGYMAVYGRMSKVTGSEVKAAPSSTGTLYCRLVYEVDLSKVNTSSSFNQGTIKILQSATGYPTLTQENLDEGGSVYQLPLAKFTATNGTVASLVDERSMVDNAGEFLTLGGTKYKLRVSSTDAGQQGFITFVI